jgi:hypothetical protein
MAGACWHCTLMPVRLHQRRGLGVRLDAAAAIYYAVNNGAKVINMSWVSTSARSAPPTWATSRSSPTPSTTP